MTSSSGAPTMADVAQRAGVSHQTVSRVLNESAAVREQTREAVLKAIAELGYRRNSAARALVTRRSGLIGVIVDELSLYGPASTVAGIAQAAREAGYTITLDPLWAINGGTIANAIERQREQAVEGIVLVAGHGEIPADVVHDLDVPIIAVDGYLGPDAASTGVDQEAGAALATQHLLDLGHRRIAHISGPSDWPQAQARRRGYEKAMTQQGVPLGPIADGDWSPHSGHAAAVQIIESNPDATAFFVANDHMAIGALRALADRGLRVPDHVSVVGFDDVPMASFTQPPLTTIRQDFTALGKELVTLVLAQINGAAPTQERLTPQLVLRGSTR